MPNAFEATSWNPDAIRPAQKGQSDKFRWNLYRFVRRHRPSARERGRQAIARKCLSVLAVQYGPHLANRTPVAFDEKSFRTWQLFVGFIDEGRWAMGQSLSHILVGKLGTFAFAPEQMRFTDATMPRDVTDWFWNGYLSAGRALWDPNGTDWMIGAENRFEPIDADTKRCRWSGRLLKRHVTTQTVECENWRAA